MANTTEFQLFDLPNNLTSLTLLNGENCWLVAGLRTKRDVNFLTLILLKKKEDKVEALYLPTDVVVKGQYEICTDPHMSLILCRSFSPGNQAVVAYHAVANAQYKKACLASHPVLGMAIGSDLTIALSYRHYVSFWQQLDGKYCETRMCLPSELKGECTSLSSATNDPNSFYLLTWLSQTFFSIQSCQLAVKAKTTNDFYLQPDWKLCWNGCVGDIRQQVTRSVLRVSPDGKYALILLNDSAYLTDMHRIIQLWNKVKDCGFMTASTLFLQTKDRLLTFDCVTKTIRDLSEHPWNGGVPLDVTVSQYGISTFFMQGARGTIKHFGFNGFTSISGINQDLDLNTPIKVSLSMAAIVTREKPKVKSVSSTVLGLDRDLDSTSPVASNPPISHDSYATNSSVLGHKMSELPNNELPDNNLEDLFIPNKEELAFQIEQLLNQWLSVTQEIKPNSALLTSSVMYDQDSLTFVFHRGRKIVQQMKINANQGE